MISPWTPTVVGDRPAQVDAGELRRAHDLLIDAGSPVFVQELPTGRWRVVPPADPDALRAAVTELSESRGTFWAFNPLPAGHAGTVRVGDVTRRHNLMIDIDPIKAHGHEDDNATDEEHEKTREVAAAIVAELTGLGWPQPAVIDSGNGWYLFYRVDLPNTPHSRSLLKAFLAALAGRHPGAVIDPKVINANRVAKIPGTWARKGPHSAGRPHRLCRVVSAPAALEVVTAEQVAAAAPGYQRPAPAGAAPTAGPANGAPPNPFRPPRSPGRRLRTADGGRPPACLSGGAADGRVAVRHPRAQGRVDDPAAGGGGGRPFRVGGPLGPGPVGLAAVPGEPGVRGGADANGGVPGVLDRTGGA
jgi:hypothetical protein